MDFGCLEADFECLEVSIGCLDVVNWGICALMVYFNPIPDPFPLKKGKGGVALGRFSERDRSGTTEATKCERSEA